jgi:CRISPR/Cas system-associated endoribonuclease Cas2
MPQRDLYLAAYDISEPHRLTAALKLTRAYATGGQKSVNKLYLTSAKEEFTLSLLLLDRAQLEVKTEGDALALYEAGVRRGTVPVKLIDRCVIHEAQTRLDSGVLMRLAEAGVTTTLMSPRSPRRVAVVRAKLARQRRTLQHLKNQHPDARKPLFDALLGFYHRPEFKGTSVIVTEALITHPAGRKLDAIQPIIA